MEKTHTAIIGAGHAGLAVSKLLSDRCVEHVVLERSTIASRWHEQRWDSFTLLTPNWATWLPGWHYGGPDPHGFMNRGEVVSYFRRYARSFDPPIREDSAVHRVSAGHDGTYRLETNAGEMTARCLVVATGPYQSPKTPGWAESLTQRVVQLHSSAYRSGAQLPDGSVLVVGSGPSGQQIAEDLQRSGRKVYISVGRHRRVPRRYRGRDYYWWYELGGGYERTAEDLPSGQPRGAGIAPVLTGVEGGHDLDLRQLHANGATLLGRAVGGADETVELDPDLFERLTEGDRAYDTFLTWVESRLFRFDGLFGKREERERFPDPPEPPTRLDLDEAGISAVVWATGFQPAYSNWLDLNTLDASGWPRHVRGVTALPGVYFIGIPWLHRQRSAFIRGAEEDANHLVAKIVGG